ncbi:restriction endonuclease subunit S [Clostridium perfringens]|uniref:restriction endonuclease subunit S n=1 Tax=Clostridium perfringens TaxID=1502 RepID=UPI003BAC57D8|nr:restriction endonuclease subunit S [Clostridium perfringens]MDK0793692.1 restriction endonuclease subunit S [Clostridium perfringens]
MTYKRYEKYKYSGIDWIGEVPAHWNIGGMTKYIDNIVDYRGKTPEKVKEGIFLVTAKNIKDGVINYDNSKEYVKYDDYEEVMKRGKPKIGEVLFTTEAPLGEVANVDNENIALAQRIIKFSSNKQKLNNYFLKYWILSNGFQNNLKSLATGSTAEGIKSSKLFNLKVVLPTISEQETIVRFLDSNISKIDSLIEEKEKLIKLLKEKREAIITEAVTKGVDKNVKMKDSGVEWIGNIPGNWNIKKLRYLGELQNGISKSAEYFGKGFPFVSYSDVYKNEEIPKEVNGKVESTTSERKLYSVKEGDVFFTRTSETIEEIGFASTCFSSLEDSTFAGFLIRFRAYEEMLYKGFSKYYFRSNIHRRFFVKEMNIVTRASLSQELLKQLPVLIPTINEQKKIYDFLNRKSADIDMIITDIKIQINSLNEYKKSLISEVVTGKIDVRNKV